MYRCLFTYKTDAETWECASCRAALTIVEIQGKDFNISQSPVNIFKACLSLGQDIRPCNALQTMVGHVADKTSLTRTCDAHCAAKVDPGHNDDSSPCNNCGIFKGVECTASVATCAVACVASFGVACLSCVVALGECCDCASQVFGFPCSDCS